MSGITYTTQDSVSESIPVDAAPATIYTRVVESNSVRQDIVTSIRSAADGQTLTEFLEQIEDSNVRDDLAGTCVKIARGDQRGAWRLFAFLRDLHTHAEGFDGAAETLAALLGLGDTTSGVGFEVGQAFEELRNDQRETICSLIASLARACDVRVVASTYTQRWLREHHREDLPGVSDQCKPPRNASSVEDAVGTARVELDYDSRGVAILRQLRENDTETASFHEIVATSEVGRSSVSVWASRLEELDLAARFDGGDGRHIELLEAGRELLDTLDAEIGTQSELGECVSGSSKSLDDNRVAHTTGQEGVEGGHPSRRADGIADVAVMERWRGAAADATAPETGVAVVDTPVERKNDPREAEWYYNEDADRLVVSAEYRNVLQYAVTVARALTNWRTFDHVLTEDRLADEEYDFNDLCTEHRHILRQSRCLGYLPDTVGSPGGFADELAEAREHLLELTRRYYHGDYEDKQSFRATITREALGLAGTVRHTLDMCGVDLVQEARVPNAARDFDDEDEAALRSHLATTVAINSRYKHFAAYRQLYEDREDKRQSAIAPDVDATSPHGEMLGAIVVTGPFNSRYDAFVDDLADALGNPKPTHDDAPEFSIHVPVERGASRPAYAQTVRRLCANKSMAATREAVSVLQGFAATPYDVARALHTLSKERENVGRDIGLDECCYALSRLGPARLGIEASPSACKLVSALLSADGSLQMADLCSMADISRSSFYNHRDTLEALGVLEETPEGYRLALPLTYDERRTRGDGFENVPAALDETTYTADVIYDALGAAAPADVNVSALLGDPDSVLFDVISGLKPLDALRDIDWLSPWISLVMGLAGDTSTPPSATARMGPCISHDQTSLQEAAT